jgi:hypothetical protein
VVWLSVGVEVEVEVEVEGQVEGRWDSCRPVVLGVRARVVRVRSQDLIPTVGGLPPQGRGLVMRDQRRGRQWTLSATAQRLCGPAGGGRCESLAGARALTAVEPSDVDYLGASRLGFRDRDDLDFSDSRGVSGAAGKDPGASLSSFRRGCRTGPWTQLLARDGTRAAQATMRL